MKKFACPIRLACFIILFGGGPLCAQRDCSINNVELIADKTLACDTPAVFNFQSIILADTTPELLRTEVSSTDFQDPFEFEFQTADNGCFYILKISGSYAVWSNPTELVDARFRFEPNTNDALRQEAPIGLDIPPAAQVAPEGYNPAHEYEFFYRGDGNPVRIRFKDPGQYNDNSGKLTFEWFAVPCFDTLWNVAGQQTTGQPELNYTFEKAGSYSVSLKIEDKLNGCRDSVTQSVYISTPPEVGITSAASCPDDSTGSVALDVTGPWSPYTYRWAGGITNDASRSRLSAGAYEVTISDSLGCDQVVDFKIENVDKPKLTLQTQPVSCVEAKDGIVRIFSTDNGLTYSLDSSGFRQDTFFSGLEAGGFELYVQTPQGCIFKEGFFIDSPDAIIVSVPERITVKRGETTRLSAIVTGGEGVYDFNWSPRVGLSCSDCQNPVASPDTSTQFQIVVTDESGCTATATVLVRVETGEAGRLYIPNAFSPNNDGINDRLTIYGGQELRQIISFKIFDRWGSLVFENLNFQANDIGNGWDGRWKDKSLANGVFAWVARVEWQNGAIATYTGDVLILK